MKERLEHATNEPDDSSLASDADGHGDPDRRRSHFGGRGDERHALHREFRLTVKECLEPIGLVAKFVFGSSADADAVDPTLFSLSGPEAPENVGLEIGDDDHLAFEPGKERRINAVGTGKDYVFNVRLKETRPTVRGGRFSRPVTVLVEFI
jgi:type 1 fimbria pilin